MHKAAYIGNSDIFPIFYQMYEKAVDNDDDRMIVFCKAIFDAYDEYGYNGHIQRPNGGRD